jgi:hypothetical protein
VLRYAIVDEVTPLHEVDGVILLGGLGFTRSLNVRRHLLLIGGSIGGRGENIARAANGNWVRMWRALAAL